MSSGKNINEWATELKHNEKVAKKYQGVKDVEDILNIAHKDGYTFSKKELLEFDLGAVAGGKKGKNKKPKSSSGGGMGNVSADVGDVDVGDISANIERLINFGPQIENTINSDVKLYNTGANSSGYIDYKPNINVNN